jgi:PKD repeat protein
MQHINRREIIKTTGAGAGIALGAGAASGETAVTSSDSVGTTQEVVSTFEAGADSAAVAIDVDPSEYENNPEEVLQQVEFGQSPITISGGEILDNGELTASQVLVPNAIDALLALDPTERLADFIENELDIYEDIINEFTLEEVQNELISFINQLNIGDAQVTAIEDLLTVLNSELNLGLPLGLLPLDTILQNPESGIPDLIALLETLTGISIDTTEDLVDAVRVLINDLVIGDDGEPIEDIDGLLPWLADQIRNLDPSNFLSLVNVEIEGDPVQGTVASPEDKLILTVPLSGATVTVELDVEEGPEPVEITFDDLSPTLTTGESGNLTGEFTDINTGGDTATAVLVDNQFTANLTQFDLVGLVESLDLVALFEALFDLLNIDLSEYDFTLPESVQDLDIPSLVENADLLQLIANLITDEPGRHAVRAALGMQFGDGELEALLNEYGVEIPGPPPLPGGEGEPQDVDGDGLHEDVTGSGQLGITDVQFLFDNLGTPELNENAQFFKFGNPDAENPERVDIFDVQGLFTKFAEQS